MNTKGLSILLFLFFVFSGNTAAQSFLDKVLKGVEKTNQILNETDKMLGTGSNSNSSRKGRNGSLQVELPHPDLTLQLTRCILSGRLCLIDFVLTNNGDDARIDLGGRSSTAFDDLGNQYKTISIGAGGSPNWEGKALFPSGVPVNCRIEIENVKNDASVFKRINIVGYCSPLNLNGNTAIIISNLPITRQDNSATIVAPAETSTDNSTGTLESAVPATTVDEDFITFEDKFIGNSRFQTQRIKFDNLGTNGDGEKITIDNWVVMKNKPSSVDPKQYKFDEKLTADKCIQKVWVEDSEFTLEYTFTKLNGRWYLTKVFERF